MGFTGPGRYGRAKWAKWLLTEARKNKYKPNNKSIEIIGLPSAVFTHITTDSVPGSLTQTTFDTDSRADSAQILLTNSTGSSKIIIAAWIRGKPVMRLSDGNGSRSSGERESQQGRAGKPTGAGGYLHDKYVDYESIAKNGEQTFETGNNFVVTADQVNKLADYYWKLNKTKKHIYTLSLVGFQSWYEPGEWYTLQIGGVGEAEYIDSTVECFDVRCSISAGGAPSTSVSFREVEEAWKFDSNEVARQVASGGFSRRPSQNVVTVAAQYYSGYADYYCDGTDDQIEINDAILHVNQGGGGDVMCLRGIFNITSSITQSSGVGLCGERGGTYFNKAETTSFSMVYAVGSAGVYIHDISVDGITFNSATSYNCGYAINYLCVDTARITNTVCAVPFTFGYNIVHGNNCSIVNNVIRNDTNINVPGIIGDAVGIQIYNTTTSRNCLVDGNVIDNMITNVANDLYWGIAITDIVSQGPAIIVNNTVRNLQSTTSSTCVGIRVQGLGIVVSSNKVEGTATGGGSVRAFYIVTGSTNVSCTNNNAYNNGSDTGLANTNLNNFYDCGTDTQYSG
jgi:hypothetical protein